MNRRDFLKTVGGAVGIGGLGVTAANRRNILKYIIDDAHKDGKYDFDDELLDNFENLLYGNIEYKTKIKYKSGGVEREKNSFGCGFRKGNKLITADHLINMDQIPIRTPIGMMYNPVKTTERHAYFPSGEGEIIFRDAKNDLALIEMPYKHGKEFPLGNSDELRPGHIVSTVGKPAGKKEIVRTSRVVSKDGGSKLISCDLMGPENIFLVWAQNYPGDSGGPVYAHRDGEPEVVGQVLSIFNGIGEDHKINHIKHLLKKYI